MPSNPFVNAKLRVNEVVLETENHGGFTAGRCVACGASGWLDSKYGYPHGGKAPMTNRLIHKPTCPMNSVLTPDGRIKTPSSGKPSPAPAAKQWNRGKDPKKFDITEESLERLREALEVEHEHPEGMNECWICDQPLVEAAVSEINYLRRRIKHHDVPLVGALNNLIGSAERFVLLASRHARFFEEHLAADAAEKKLVAAIKSARQARETAS